MVLYYALGGGLGHVTRARAVLHTLGIESDAVISVSSPEAASPRFAGSVPVRLVPLELACNAPACRDWLAQILTETNPSALFLDAFPAGILGELSGFTPPKTLAVHHVARLLNASCLDQLLTPTSPKFETTYLVEQVSPEHRRWLTAQSNSVRHLELVDPPAAPDPESATPSPPYWLIVHSGPVEEVAELLGFAADMRELENSRVQFLLIAPHVPPSLPPDTASCTSHPSAALFATADRIIGAGGFNFVRQTAPFRAKTRYLPFPRRYDDQFLRVARAQPNHP